MQVVYGFFFRFFLVVVFFSMQRLSHVVNSVVV